MKINIASYHIANHNNNNDILLIEQGLNEALACTADYISAVVLIKNYLKWQEIQLAMHMHCGEGSLIDHE